ncbi:hypothetical protein [Pasteurella multocida]|uniref:hypothetical protein n=1 Tax=Pasteurella multocida TaxID=747 RepID=UPI0007760103|nr:hypothetical protein [Pasteurella multocida]AMM82943.1 hypothetical protein AW43_03605 [Pasteurella multocida subsp. multocida PMTB2.1]APW58138.1 hypothetical protein BV212_08440 [Pasteurella multocida]ATC21371.1 hypothetical protein CLD33_04560 [Pasteurella multocida]MCH4803384.1 hypothetical protein [Pasteurella multocida]MCL7849513.1 hypothetical protein [Pasteurella multocida]
MLNRFARILLTISSISPICLSISLLIGLQSIQGIDEIPHKLERLLGHLLAWELSQKECVFLLSIGLFVVSVLLFPWVFYQAKKQAILQHPTQAFKLTSVTPAHREMANYFISYLFPLMAGAEIFSNLGIAVFFYMSIFIWVSYSGACTFNPILAFMGYKFYEAERSNNVHIIFIARNTLLDIDNSRFKVVRLTEHTYLQVKD